MQRFGLLIYGRNEFYNCFCLRKMNYYRKMVLIICPYKERPFLKDGLSNKKWMK